MLFAASRGLVYADIGASFNYRSNQPSIASIDLAADRPVEYAQIYHTPSTLYYVVFESTKETMD